MSFTSIWIHAVWSTKNRKPLLLTDFRDDVFNHILENGKKHNIYIDTINGYLEHVHCLLSMNRHQSISECVKLLKGESAFWINKNKISKFKFNWQDDYFATSISCSDLNELRKYINNQSTHHRKVSFQEEYNNFLKNIKHF